MKTTIKTLITLALFLVSIISTAAPFSITSTGIQSAPDPDGYYILGQTMTTTIIVDNGGTITQNQTWSATDVVSITFSVNSGAITTIFRPNTAPADGLDHTGGDFTTDNSGILISAPSWWGDDGWDTNTVSNDIGVHALIWRVNPELILYGVITPDIPPIVHSPAAWSNPRSLTQAAPTLSQWVLILLALMLGGIGFQAARKTQG